ncbi:putative transcriptional regulator [Streptomyces ambofaciens ATCC 23877]|uniref:Putative transcriptional regulator n=1 Tax=Streptomyces ambofaciens (strain ATCC 23877 / 3486 / DSM 40053 / JCM 4204 / NBRC 12836 / NRRL B-2516) TaxID=278992 RepID=A3KJT8_STRA7|nr:sugar-binding domain-containing protein [Streptomyces ambofaciens]AKZ54127.1 putative transcriptional regulator [Streptomyces ambofaciens ATCC 23877]CAJ89973.1 putative transcriptional regulator [Streptomyces ambofaciens ATCC 23877]
MAEPTDTVALPAPVDTLLAAAVARRFYLEQRPKVEIAKEFGISRFKVARLLDAAVAHDIVRIDISVPAELDVPLGRALTERFGLRHGIVVDLTHGGTASSADPRHSARWLGTAAARLIAEIAEDGDVLGLDGSHAVDAMSEAVTRLPLCDVVQLTGVHGRDLAQDAAIAAVRRTAAVGGGRAFPLHTPFLLPDAATAAVLRSQPATAETLERIGRVTKAVVGIGAWDAPHSTVYGALSEREREALRRSAACAEVAGHVLDAAGRFVPTELTARTIAVGAADLRGVEELIGVTGGGHGTGAVRAVLRSGLLTGVVTDAATARRLLWNDDPDGTTRTAPSSRTTERGPR